MIARVPEPQPMSGINTTPLIDVMLVLLIMFIITLPATTHKVAVDLPTPGPRTAPEPVVHRLTLDRAGGLAWDGAAIAQAELPARLAAMVGEPGEPVLHMATHPEARYERFDQTLATIRQAGVERLGFVGNRPLED